MLVLSRAFKQSIYFKEINALPYIPIDLENERQLAHFLTHRVPFA